MQSPFKQMQTSFNTALTAIGLTAAFAGGIGTDADAQPDARFLQQYRERKSVSQPYRQPSMSTLPYIKTSNSPHVDPSPENLVMGSIGLNIQNFSAANAPTETRVTERLESEVVFGGFEPGLHFGILGGFEFQFFSQSYNYSYGRRPSGAGGGFAAGTSISRFLTGAYLGVELPFITGQRGKFMTLVAPTLIAPVYGINQDGARLGVRGQFGCNFNIDKYVNNSGVDLQVGVKGGIGFGLNKVDATQPPATAVYTNLGFYAGVKF